MIVNNLLSGYSDNISTHYQGDIEDLEMDLDVEVYRSSDDYIFMTVRGPAQGLVQFADINTLIAFLIDCQVLLGSFDDNLCSSNSIPDVILKAFNEEGQDYSSS